ncbi:hypothetical protein FA15DRAFT_619505 [Coprinopsis marcescibilis]|uniref:BTB domain-containing protein n=1 Tax=Coprinopsis marcescibilis TaxID=230819 RepID=A0A5C3KVI2_COPMA|nr:hypothetical protein FA15DRAFT_619505 [Coprinopsis marcescibilis]
MSIASGNVPATHSVTVSPSPNSTSLSKSTPSSATTDKSTTLAAAPTHAWGGWEGLIRSDFWFPDGNIVLLAGSAAFRVHKGQLERQSEVFRDLFMVPQPISCAASAGGEGVGGGGCSNSSSNTNTPHLIDGCPWVELHDRPSDVFYFLSAIYDGLYFTSPRSNDFPKLSAVLRLSTKYLVPSLHALCLARLQLDWPSTLAGWDARELAAVDDKGRYMPRETCCHPLLLMELAVELGLDGSCVSGGSRNETSSSVPSSATTSETATGAKDGGSGAAEPVDGVDAMDYSGDFLKAAFYDLCRYGPSKIMSGTSVGALALDVAAGSVGGGSVASDAASAYGMTRVKARDIVKERSVTLNRDMLIRTFKGREAAQKYISEFVEKELEGREPARDCLWRSHYYASGQTGNKCIESFYFIVLNILRSVGGIACGRDADPLYTLLQAKGMLNRRDFRYSGTAATAMHAQNGGGGGVGAGAGTGGGGGGNANDGTDITDGDGEGIALQICCACKRDFEKSVNRAREEVWSRLGGWFGLE